MVQNINYDLTTKEIKTRETDAGTSTLCACNKRKAAFPCVLPGKKRRKQRQPAIVLFRKNGKRSGAPSIRIPLPFMFSSSYPHEFTKGIFSSVLRHHIPSPMLYGHLTICPLTNIETIEKR